jgi:hypothetical protein
MESCQIPYNLPPVKYVQSWIKRSIRAFAHAGEEDITRIHIAKRCVALPRGRQVPGVLCPAVSCWSRNQPKDLDFPISHFKSPAHQEHPFCIRLPPSRYLTLELLSRSSATRLSTHCRLACYLPKPYMYFLSHFPVLFLRPRSFFRASSGNEQSFIRWVVVEVSSIKDHGVHYEVKDAHSSCHASYSMPMLKYYPDRAASIRLLATCLLFKPAREILVTASLSLLLSTSLSVTPKMIST